MCYMATASIIGVRELRQNLSVYLDRVKRGEALTVTEHHQVVAVLQPPPTASTLVDRLVAAGRARRATRAITALPRPIALKTGSLRLALDEQREERV